MPHHIDGHARAAVLAAACDRILEQQGPAGLTWRAISRVSEISTSSMRHHLQDHQRLLRVCAHVSATARTTALTAAVIEHGPLAVLPRDHHDLPATRTWLGWLEVGRTDPSIGSWLQRPRRQQLAVLARSLDHRVPGGALAAVEALVDGLRVSLCLPGSTLITDEAQACLADRLGELTGSVVEPGRPWVAREDWAFPYVPGRAGCRRTSWTPRLGVMRFGLTILPDLPWAEAAPRWRAAEELGFDHAWTYDHLVWGGLPESPWFGTTPTLTAAALVTSRIRLGTFVASPNFRHPVALHRDVQSLDDVSGGRFLLGVGTGGDLDSRILGAEDLSVKERVDRFQEFTDLLVRLRTEDHVDADGRWFSARDARTLPPLRDVPLLVAANGPRSLRYAARTGDGWITTGGRAETLDEWFAGLAQARTTLEAELERVGRDAGDGSAYPRYLNLDSSPRFSLESADLFEEMTGRAAELGFTDVITHWPRAEAPYAGREATLEQVASRLAGLR